ncbi:MAG: prepilin-type N-terminal cleavage/methylation domain-containing protein [Saccharofermentans sp.]|nr:prepilin-type N-terminal cleavage/methylation domain-containing protein [Saccharofermentans sp.]
MKNLLKNRKGFTLAEILLVVAIIAILSGATVIGVASWVNSSKQTAEQLTHNAADFEPGAYASVKAKKGTLPSYVEETETLNTGETEGTKSTQESKETKKDTTDNNSGSNNPAQTTAATTKETTAATTAATTAGQGGAQEIHHNSGGGSSTNFSTSSGTHWDPNVDRGYDEWGNHMVGANVADTTSQGDVSFGNTNVSSFVVSVSGKVMEYTCNDWRYTISNNGDGTYTVTYTANQYEHNPPISSINLRFKVDGDKAATIKVTSYTEYKK